MSSLRTPLALLLITISLHGQQANARGVIADLPIGGPMTVKTLDGRELHGNLSAIDPDTFSLREVDLKALVTVRYDEVQKVTKDYGRKGFGGRRVSPGKRLITGLIVIGALVALVLIAVAADKS